LQTNASLESRHGPAQRRLRNTQLRRRASEIALPGNGDETGEIVEVFVH
jgi:hypothetical protein